MVGPPSNTPMRATLQRIDRGDVVILKISGRMTIDTSGSEEILKGDIERALKQGKKLFVIDGADVAYADSAGLGEMVRSYTRVTRDGGRMVFAVPDSHHLRSRFHLTKLDRELSLYTSVDE